MKTKMKESAKRQVAGDQTSILPHCVRSPHASRLTSHVSAFTIVELLTVITIIAILAAMLLPALSAAKTHALKAKARLQIGQIVTAIDNYDSIYSRMPIPVAAQQAASGSNDFTFGGVFVTPSPPGTWPNPVPPNYVTSNSDVIAILMSLTNYPGGGPVIANANNQKNPQQTVFLKADLVASTNLPGVGPDLVYRDPWKNPYVITMDINADNLCRDSFYQSSTASAGGLNGLILQSDGTYACHDNVMVWSAGPDAKIDPTLNAVSGVNKDNILSWSQ